MNIKMKKLGIAAAIVAAFFPAVAGSQGAIRGRVIDKTNGLELIGASVQLDGTDQVVFTDVNGAYALPNVEVGVHTVIASFPGFATTRVEGVEVVQGEVAKVDIFVTMDSFMTEMVVTAELTENTEATLLKYRQKSLSISDAISAELIGRSGGSNAADAVKKITGASVVGGKYVYIRGLGDRYSSTHLNGTELPTADPDVKSFQADLFPASLLDNIVTIKSFTPDKPGNFSGGIIDIGTKEYPDEFTFSVGYSTAYNTQTTGSDAFYTYSGSGSDWLGKDDGLRALPSIFDDPELAVPSLIDARRDEEKALLLDRISKSFEPVMSGSDERAPFDQGFSVSLGNQKEIWGKKFGVLGSLTYNRGYDVIDNWTTARWKLAESAESASGLINQSQFTARQGVDKVVWGGLASMRMVPAANHEIGFNLIYSQSGESKAHVYSGAWPEQFSGDGTTLESRLLKYTERNLTTTQLNGQHYLPGFLEMNLSWTASVSSTFQDEPDTRIFTDHYSDRMVNGEEMTIYSITPSNYNNPARYFRELDEDATGLQLDAQFPFTQWNGIQGHLKVGVNLSSKTRDFNELRFEYLPDSGVRYDGDAASFFGLDNVGLVGYDESRDRYLFGNVIQYSPDSRGGDYDGDEDINAYYVMLELPLTEKLKMITGGRMEQATMNITNDSSVGVLDEDDFLPALQFIYALSENQNLRAAYGRTLARPNFREKAPYASYDFIADGIFVGNPELERTLIDNLDLRWELFSRPGEILAFSGFYKDFENPIERAYNVRTTTDFGEKTYLNVDQATVYGVECEIRKRFDQLFLAGDSSHIFSIGANLSLIESIVDIPEEELEFIRQRDPNASDTRALQGQSPYLINLGLNYDNYEWGTSASVFYNVFGERLDEVGVGGAPNALEQPRQVVDFVFSQRVWKDFTAKFTAKNLLDSAYEITQEFKGTSYVRSEYQTGRSFSLGFSYKP